jgi:hypothetical protein
LGGVGERLAIDGALVQELSLVTQLFDDVDGSFLLCTVGLHGGLAIAVPLAHVAHGTLEARPILLLLRCQAQVCFDTSGTSAKFVGDLIRRKLGSVGAIAAGSNRIVAEFRAPAILHFIAAALLRLILLEPARAKKTIQI